MAQSLLERPIGNRCEVFWPLIVFNDNVDFDRESILGQRDLSLAAKLAALLSAALAPAAS